MILLQQMIAATAVCGMVYAALAGQPLTIIGSTGPVLAFIAVLYKTAARMVRDISLQLSKYIDHHFPSQAQRHLFRSAICLSFPL